MPASHFFRRSLRYASALAELSQSIQRAKFLPEFSPNLVVISPGSIRLTWMGVS